MGRGRHRSERIGVESISVPYICVMRDSLHVTAEVHAQGSVLADHDAHGEFHDMEFVDERKSCQASHSAGASIDESPVHCDAKALTANTTDSVAMRIHAATIMRMRSRNHAVASPVMAEKENKVQ